MIGRSPIRNKSEMIFPQKAEPYRKLEVLFLPTRSRTPELKAFRERPAFKISTPTSNA